MLETGGALGIRAAFSRTHVHLDVKPQRRLIPSEKCHQLGRGDQTTTCQRSPGTARTCRSLPGCPGCPAERREDRHGGMGPRRLQGQRARLGHSASVAAHRPPAPTATPAARGTRGPTREELRLPGAGEGSSYLSVKQKNNPQPPSQCVLSLPSNSPLPCHSTAHPSIGHFV